MSFFYSIWGIRRIILEVQNFYFNHRYRYFVNKVKIFGLPIIYITKKSQIEIGRNLVLISESYFSEPGINHPVIIRTLRPNAKIKIGNNVGISGGGICSAEEVVIGNDVLMGANVFVTDTDFHPLESKNRRYIRKCKNCPC